MSIAWTDDLATGAGKIDDQHRELFNRINSLLAACRQGIGKNEVEKIISFLEDYAIKHFSEEERCMNEYGYPEYGNHKGQHLEFMENLSKIKKQLETDGPGVHVVLSTNRMVVDWLITHIRRTDKALGAFLKSQRANITSWET